MQIFFGRTYEHYHLLHQIGRFLFAGLIGGFIGAFFSDRFKKYRKIFFLTVLALLIIIGLNYSPGFALFLGFWTGAILAYMLLRILVNRGRQKPTTFGSAEWATLEHLQQNGLIEPVDYVAAPLGTGTAGRQSGAGLLFWQQFWQQAVKDATHGR